jgi:carboxyl-terminal processing protease
MRRWLLALTLVLSLPARSFAQSDCSVPGQNLSVRNLMRDWYLWYQQLPDPNPALFASPDAYLDAVRYRTLDRNFSFIITREAADALFGAGQSVAFGIRVKVVGADRLMVASVIPDSPAAEAGLRRGGEILAVDGVAASTLIAGNSINAAFGPGEVGVTVRLTYREPDGPQRELTMTKRVITEATVPLVRSYDLGGRRVGYVVFTSFLEPSSGELDAAFSALRAEGVSDLVLDLRYNGGGLVSVAQHLGGLIGGSRTNAQVFAQLVFNDKNTSRNQVYRFEDAAAALDLTRLVVITSRGSASASETIINSLRPFMTVTTVGDATYGKPVGQSGFVFCDKYLFPVTFSVRNSANQGDYFDGLPADCAAPDDVERDFGDPAEGSLAAALQFVATGSCSPAAAARALSGRTKLPPGVSAPHSENGWRQLVGFY